MSTTEWCSHAETGPRAEVDHGASLPDGRRTTPTAGAGPRCRSARRRRRCPRRVSSLEAVHLGFPGGVECGRSRACSSRPWPGRRERAPMGCRGRSRSAHRTRWAMTSATGAPVGRLTLGPVRCRCEQRCRRDLRARRRPENDRRRQRVHPPPPPQRSAPRRPPEDGDVEMEALPIAGSRVRCLEPHRREPLGRIDNVTSSVTPGKNRGPERSHRVGDGSVRANSTTCTRCGRGTRPRSRARRLIDSARRTSCWVTPPTSVVRSAIRTCPTRRSTLRWSSSAPAACATASMNAAPSPNDRMSKRACSAPSNHRQSVRSTSRTPRRAATSSTGQR